MTVGFFRSIAAQDGGQSLVEVALALPILLLIVLGIVDVGRAYAYKTAVTNAAREAAIYAAREPQASLDDICRRAREELGIPPLPPAADPCRTAPVTIARCDRGGAPCDNETWTMRQDPLFGSDSPAGVSVTVRFDVALLTGYLIGLAFPVNPVPVTATATFGGMAQ